MTLTQIRISPSSEIADIKKRSSRFGIYSHYPRSFGIILAKEEKRGQVPCKFNSCEDHGFIFLFPSCAKMSHNGNYQECKYRM